MKSTDNKILNVFEQLADIRHKLELTFVEQVQQNIQTIPMINSGMNLMKVAINRRYEFEKDVFGKLRQFSSSPTSGKEIVKRPEETEEQTQEIIQVITVTDPHLVHIPLNIQNRSMELQQFEFQGGEILDYSQRKKVGETIKFDPPSLILKEGESTEINAVLEIDNERFASGQRYCATFTIKSDYEKKMNIIIDILDKEKFGTKSYPIIRMV